MVDTVWNGVVKDDHIAAHPAGPIDGEETQAGQTVGRGYRQAIAKRARMRRRRCSAAAGSCPARGDDASLAVDDLKQDETVGGEIEARYRENVWIERSPILVVDHKVGG